jgi:SAM-dependent methyltransferase
MVYTDGQLKELLDDIIDNIYKKNHIILSNLWNSSGEQKYLDSLHKDYEKILLDFNTIFPERNTSPRVLEISSFLGVVDIALAKIGFETYTYDIPEFQDNTNLKNLYQDFNVRQASGRVHDIGKNGLPYPDNFFDAVILSEVLEHLNVNPLPVVQEINRVLKINGILYLTTPNQVNLINRMSMLSGRSVRNSLNDFVIQSDETKKSICGIHWREYTITELKELLEITGFSSQNSTFSHRGNENAGLPLTKKIFFRFLRSICTAFPHLDNSITIIAIKKEFRPIKFWFYDEYIKYYPTIQ